MKDWLTVPEAAMLIGRSKRTIWRWIDAGDVASRINSEGMKEARAADIRQAEATMRLGRPKATRG